MLTAAKINLGSENERMKDTIMIFLKNRIVVEMHCRSGRNIYDTVIECLLLTHLLELHLQDNDLVYFNENNATNIFLFHIR